MKVAIFGGSFNPFHNGHQQIIDEILKKEIVEEIWVIPCGNHSFGKELISGEKRLEMLKLAINNPSVKILDYEIKKPGKSYSADMIRSFKNDFPENEFFIIIGADNLEVINKWHDFEFLKKEVKFIVAKRPGYELNNVFKIKIIQVLDLNTDISSSKIRSDLWKGTSPKNLMPKQINEYILKNKLYFIENAT
jgi:nicotinate-nucleotide adenylyltransferase